MHEQALKTLQRIKNTINIALNKKEIFDGNQSTFRALIRK